MPGSVSMDMRVNLALPGDLTDVEERGGEAQEPCKLFFGINYLRRFVQHFKITFQPAVSTHQRNLFWSGFKRGESNEN